MHLMEREVSRRFGKIKAMRDSMARPIKLKNSDCVFWALSAFWVMEEDFPERFDVMSVSRLLINHGNRTIESGLSMYDQIVEGPGRPFHAMVRDRETGYFLDCSAFGWPNLVTSMGGSRKDCQKLPKRFYYGPERPKGSVFWYEVDVRDFGTDRLGRDLQLSMKHLGAV